MGNTACCDQQNKGPEFKIQATKVERPNNHSTIRYQPFNEQKTFNQPPPQGKPSQQSPNEPNPKKMEEKQHSEHSFESHQIQFAELKQEPIKEEPVNQTPKMTSQVQQVLHQKNFFLFDLPDNPVHLPYGQDYYQGEINENSNVPEGWGKLYKNDGSIYIGQFVNGGAEGEGAYIFPDGSYYRGSFKNNRGEGPKGYFHGSHFEYSGDFRNNTFEGKGEEKGNNYTFKGEFKDGHRVKGELHWIEGVQKYKYEGSFNEANQFEGNGVLKDPKGCYKGQFKNGHKEGKGSYEYKNGLLYEGEYWNGTRHGKGALYNPGRKLVYEGDFEEGMPHGSGDVLNEQGLRQSTKWVRGISSELIGPD